MYHGRPNRVYHHCFHGHWEVVEYIYTVYGQRAEHDIFLAGESPKSRYAKHMESVPLVSGEISGRGTP